MNNKKRYTENRVILFDNLRYLFVLCVVLLHSGQAYTNMVKWWPVSDQTSKIIDPLFFLLNTFSIPLLFYIAGYFAVPVMQKKGIGSFLKGKLKKLGIPWLVCILTICPVLPLVYHYTRNNFTLSMSYWDLWVLLMRNMAELNVGIISSMSALMKNNIFYQRYMWFLSLLLLFFFIFAAVYKAKRNWFDTTSRPVAYEKPSVLSTLKLLFAVGFLTFFGGGIMLGIMMVVAPKPFNPMGLFSFGNIIQFPMGLLLSYIIYFGFGIITYQRKWIERGIFPGHLKTWVISVVILLIIYLYGFIMFWRGFEEYKYLFGFVSTLLTMPILGASASFAIKYWNRPTKLDLSLASNSYNIYLSHYIFVQVFQLILYTTPGIPPLLKFGIVLILTIACSYIVSRFLIKPYPRMAITGAVALFVLMILVIRP